MDSPQDTYLSSLVKIAIAEGKIPRYLYKYRKIDETLMILKNGTVYFSTLDQFNDPFEGKAIIDHNYTFNNWNDYLIRHSTPPHEAFNVAYGLTHQNKKKGKQIVEKAITKVLSQLGFYCLAKNPDNLLMWAHYTDSHKGCVVEFDIMKCLPIFERIGAVKYDANYPSYNYLIDESGPYMSIFHKSKEWSYESEYRIMNTQKSGVIDLPKEAVLSVIFGCKTSESDKASIRNLIPISKFPRASTRQVVLNPSQFKLDIQCK